MYKKNVHVHFVGIGGIGMSGIAQIISQQGHIVSGCDSNIDQKSIHDLKNLGCHIGTNNSTSLCQNNSIDTLVYSSAIAQSNPELIWARTRNIPIIHRSVMLAELMRTKYSIAVSGSHGKTTTSSLLGHVLLEAALDPTIIIGGHLQSINSNARYGQGKFLVAEADESDRSLLKLYPTLAIITNIDLEHLETYQNLHDVVDTFKNFLDRLPFYGKAIVCTESTSIKSLLPLKNNTAITYGLNKNADWSAQNIKHKADYSTYEAFYKGTLIGPVHIAMPGIHNVLNSLAVLAAAREIEISFKTITQGLSSFTGVDRRFTFKGTYKGAAIFDDYGHHPIEIRHTLETARRKTSGNIMMLFQPHRYSRTQALWNDFVNVLASSNIDYLIITDIYEASESPLKGITSKHLLASIKKVNPNLKAVYVPLEKDFLSLRKEISSNIKNGDLLLLQGAGKVNLISAQLISE